MSKLHTESSSRSAAILIRVSIAGSLLLLLSGCVEMTRVLAKLDPRTPAATVAEETPAEAAPTAAAPPPVPEERVVVEEPKPSKLYEWNAQGRKVSRILVDTNEQRATFYSGDEEVGWSTIASGLPKYPTPVGEFAVTEKVANKRSNLYGKIMKGGRVIHSNARAGREAVPAGARFEGAHMPYFLRLTSDGIGLHAGPIPRPGQPASHGCIRLPSKLAPVLFEHVSHGTQVKIVGNGPDYGNYVEKQRVAAAQRAAREAERRRVAAAQASASGIDVLTEQSAPGPHVTERDRPASAAKTPPRRSSETAQPVAQGPAPATAPEQVGAATAGAVAVSSAAAPAVSDTAPAAGPTAAELTRSAALPAVTPAPAQVAEVTAPPAKEAPAAQPAQPSGAATPVTQSREAADAAPIAATQAPPSQSASPPPATEPAPAPAVTATTPPTPKPAPSSAPVTPAAADQPPAQAPQAASVPPPAATRPAPAPVDTKPAPAAAPVQAPATPPAAPVATRPPASAPAAATPAVPVQVQQPARTDQSGGEG
jgi:hypothetical protein